MRYLKPVLGSIFWLAMMLADPATAAGEPTAGRVSDRIDVRIVNVDAVVADRRGHPVDGLERADFEVLIDGESAEITHFAVGRIGDGHPTPPTAKPTASKSGSVGADVRWLIAGSTAFATTTSWRQAALWRPWHCIRPPLEGPALMTNVTTPSASGSKSANQ